MASLTVENYVKAIFNLCSDGQRRRAATGQLALTLGLSPGTVTSMLKALSESGLATYTPYEGVQLTESGRALALRIVRRHRLIEAFLAKSLNLNWDEVHDDAEQMEHVLSDALVERIDTWLGHPEFDPHGDPIPAADGTMPAIATSRLADCPCGTLFRLARVVDQASDFLRYLRMAGVVLNARGEVIVNQPEAGVLTVRVEGRDTALSCEMAQKILVVVENIDETYAEPPLASPVSVA